MFPTKAFDCEGRRTEHALRHANVLDAVAAQPDIAGSFAWCMFDYNTHKDFGSGDRVCYHGVMDMFRNPKQAAAVYASQQEAHPVLEISSSMDIGEHPACNWEDLYIFTNADSVRMYKNDRLIRTYRQEEISWKQISHGPILIDDFVGDVLETKEHLPKKQADAVKKLLNTVARRGVNHIPKNLYPTILKLLLVYHMNLDQVTDLYTRYVGDWGGAATCYKFEAVKDGKVVKTVVKEPMKNVSLQVVADRTSLTETRGYDVACVRIRAVDEHGNVLPFYNEPVQLCVEGEGELIGPDLIAFSGGMSGTYVKTTGTSGAIQILSMMVFFPLIREWLGAMQVFFTSIGMAAAGYGSLLIFMFTNMTSIYLLFIPAFLIFAAFGFQTVLTTVFLANTVDYGELKNDRRDESVIFSMQTFVVKLASGVAALIASICLSVCRLSDDTSQAVTAAEGSVLGLRFTMTVIPIIGLIATFFIFRKRYILTEEKVEEIAAKVKEKREREAS